MTGERQEEEPRGTPVATNSRAGMSLRHIEVFHAVYVTGTVSAAARILNMSQPSVTNMLRHAESRLGFPLFERTKRRLIPTADAHDLFNDVSEIQNKVYQLRQVTQNIRRGRGSTLRVSTLPSLGLDVVPAAAAAFLAAHPGAMIELHTTHHEDMVRKLYERESDIVIGYTVPRGVPVASRRIGAGEMVALYREDDHPDLPPRVPLDMLRGWPFVTTGESGPQGQKLSSELVARGIELDTVASSRTYFIAASLVRNGLGSTVVDSYTAKAMLAPGLSLRPLDPPIPFGVHAVHLESRPLSQLACDFLDFLAARLDVE